jgi:hypothetical protein
MGEIAEKIFKERFSEELFDRFSKAYFGSDVMEARETNLLVRVKSLFT